MFILRDHKNLHTALGIKLGLVAVIAFLLAGCPVLQKPGTGRQLVLKEAQTNRTYYLYLPAGYDPSKRWPVVVTLHGLIPFDTAPRQKREWQATADKYGFIVVAPVISGANTWWVFFVTPIVKQDERAIMNIMDCVFTNTSADPDRVMITAWSGGGYLMHYMANQHPDRFAALCSRGSCFNPGILDEDSARRMGRKNFPVMVFWGQGDALEVKLDSARAVRWYESKGFYVESMVIPQSLWPAKMVLGGFGGHNRQPEMAAEFFQRVTSSSGRLRLLASPHSGAAPLAINLSVELPQQFLSEGLTYVWTLDGEPLAQTAQVHTSISEPGLHHLKVTVTDRDGRTLTASRQVTVESSGT